MEQWRPIETAPKDGTQFLAAVYAQNIKDRTAWWEIHILCLDDETGHIHDDYERGWDLVAYSHWMPLPLPPLSA